MYIHQMFGFFIMVTNFHKKCGLGLETQSISFAPLGFWKVFRPEAERQKLFHSHDLDLSLRLRARSFVQEVPRNKQYWHLQVTELSDYLTAHPARRCCIV